MYSNNLTPKEPREEVCETHGEYVSEVIFGSMRSRCPKCSEERRAEEERLKKLRDAEEDERRWYRGLEHAGIPERFKNRTIDSYVAASEGQKKALEFCKEYAENLVSVINAGRCAVFVGRPGTGKTHLAIGIALHALRNKQRVCFTSVMRLIRAIRNTWSKGSEETESEVIKGFTRPSLLIIDEIGVQVGSENEKLLLFEVLNDRYEARLPTLLLSNLPIDEVKGYLGERIFDRFREDGGVFITFDWESHRGAAQ